MKHLAVERCCNKITPRTATYEIISLWEIEEHVQPLDYLWLSFQKNFILGRSILIFLFSVLIPLSTQQLQVRRSDSIKAVWMTDSTRSLLEYARGNSSKKAHAQAERSQSFWHWAILHRTDRVLTVLGLYM